MVDTLESYNANNVYVVHTYTKRIQVPNSAAAANYSLARCTFSKVSVSQTTTANK